MHWRFYFCDNLFDCTISCRLSHTVRFVIKTVESEGLNYSILYVLRFLTEIDDNWASGTGRRESELMLAAFESLVCFLFSCEFSFHSCVQNQKLIIYLMVFFFFGLGESYMYRENDKC